MIKSLLHSGQEVNMADFPATMVVSRLKSFVEQIPSTGVPPRVTVAYLQARGFKSSNDRSIIPVLKHIGLIDVSGAPTSKWQELRDQSTGRQTLARLVRQAYSGLYEVYPDAERQPDSVIRDFMRTKTKGGDRMVVAMVSTFKMLCSLADFSGPTAVRSIVPKNLQSGNVSEEYAGFGTASEIHPPTTTNVTINLQINIGEDAGYEQIDFVFESLARHVLGRQADVPDDYEENGSEHPAEFSDVEAEDGLG